MTTQHRIFVLVVLVRVDEGKEKVKGGPIYKALNWWGSGRVDVRNLTPKAEWLFPGFEPMPR